MKKEIQKLKGLILRPGMYIGDDELFDAVNFVSGMNCGFDTPILNNTFYEWLIKEYECERTSFGWREVIMSGVPATTTNCKKSNVTAFLEILETYISHLEAA